MPPLKDKKPIEIERKKLILTEGADAYFFCMWACNAYKPDTIQVIDFGGIGDLRKFLASLKRLPRYEQVETIVVVRDAETDPMSAIDSIKGALKNEELPIPNKPCEFAGSSLRVAYIIFPEIGKDANGNDSISSGTLEDLCLRIVENDPIFECVDQYLQCLQTKGASITHSHKTKLHTYLSGKKEFVGLKIGEAAKVGAWNWDHSKLAPFRQVILTM